MRLYLYIEYFGQQIIEIEYFNENIDDIVGFYYYSGQEGSYFITGNFGELTKQGLWICSYFHKIYYL